VASVPNKRVFFFDEARFGTHSKIGHAWLETGKRTAMRVKLGFKNFYLYSAVEPKTGEHFTLEISHVNTPCLNVFLEEFARAYPHDDILLVMDGAGWHRSRNLVIPDTIEIAYLPPYSPELNPVERLWEHLKRNTIRNQIHLTLEDLKDTVGNCLNDLSQALIHSLCSAGYLYN
jgi:transposase